MPGRPTKMNANPSIQPCLLLVARPRSRGDQSGSMGPVDFHATVTREGPIENVSPTRHAGSPYEDECNPSIQPCILLVARPRSRGDQSGSMGPVDFHATVTREGPIENVSQNPALRRRI